MTCICSSLKSYNDICFLSKHIGDFTFTLISPVSSNYCFDHNTFILLVFLIDLLKIIFQTFVLWHQTLISAFMPSISLCASRTGCTVFVINAVVCSFALPTYLDGSMDF